MGGIDCGSNDRMAENKALRNSYILDFEERKLIPVAKMLIGRADHSLVVLNNEIYAVGGLTDLGQPTASCEKYSIHGNCWRQLPSLKAPRQGSSLCTFNNHYIYCIGGKVNQNILLGSIERFSLSTNKWEEISLGLSAISPANKAYFQVLSKSASLQVSHDSILVFGGSFKDGSNNSAGGYLLQLKQDNSLEAPRFHEVLAVDPYFLPTPGAFWSQQTIVYKGKIFAIQNVSREGHTDVCLNKKRVLMFNHNRFIVIN